ncbi:MAG: NHL repeat-containing protein [candidate division Zixibacteria bacterium]|nr:NHL repeat-containing protein [candidate division Zixibacteria bacterium]
MILRGAPLQRVLRVSSLGILGLILFTACVQKLGGEGSLRNRRARVVLRKPLALTIKRELPGAFFEKPISGPHSVRSDLAGNIYFIDEGAQRVIKLNKEFEPVREQGGLGSVLGLFRAPQSIAVDNSLNIYVADRELRVIQRFDQELNYVDKIELYDETDPLKFGEPSAVGVSSTGDIWISDRDQTRIVVFDRFNQFKEFYSDFSSTGGYLVSPGAIYTLGNSHVVVCDNRAGKIVMFDQFGGFLSDFGQGILKEPGDVTEDDEGRIWVVDTKLNQVFCFSPSGEELFRTGTGSRSNLGLTAPRGITSLGSNILLIADTGGDRLLVCEFYLEEE